MRIGINGTPLFGRRGIRRYTEQLIRHLTRLENENAYALFFICFRHGEEKIPRFPENKNVVISRCRIPGKVLEPLSHAFGFPSIDLFTGKLDIFHNTEENPLACRAGVYLQTIHGLHHKAVPEMMNPSYVASQKRYYDGMMKRAGVFAAVSRAVKNDLMEYYRLPGEKIFVVYPGIEEHFRILTEKEKVIAFLKKTFSLEGDFLLYVGGLDKHKNILTAVDAYSLCRRRNVFDGKLVLVGPSEHGMADYFKQLMEKIQKEKLSNDVKIIGYVNEESLVHLYNAAGALVFPSYYEGCSVTPVEAMACGCPVVTSDIPSLRETTGGAALCVSPSSPEEILTAVEKVLRDGATRKDMRARGLQWAATFNYNKTAADFLSLYEKIHARKN